MNEPTPDPNAPAPLDLSPAPAARRDIDNYTCANLTLGKRNAILAALTQGEPVRTIARRLHVGTQTILKLRELSADTLGSWRDHTKHTLEHFATLASERLVAEVDKLPHQTLPIALGIVMDKRLALDAQDTALKPVEPGLTPEAILRDLSVSVTVKLKAGKPASDPGLTLPATLRDPDADR